MPNTLTAILPIAQPISTSFDLGENITVIPLGSDFTVNAPMNLLEDPVRTLTGVTRVLLEDLSPNEFRRKTLIEDPNKNVRLEKARIAKILAEKFFGNLTNLNTVYKTYGGPGIKNSDIELKIKQLQNLGNAENQINDLRIVLSIRKKEIKLFEIGASHTSKENYLGILNYTLQKSGLDIQLDDDLMILTTYYSMKDSGNEKGFNKWPFTLSHPLDAVNLLVRHIVFDVNGLKSAKDLEDFNGWSKIMDIYPVESNYNSIMGMVNGVFPESLKGENPEIREWNLSTTNIWTGEGSDDRVKRAILFTLKHVAKVVNEDGTINPEKLSETKNWRDIFSSDENDLSGMLQRSKVRNVKDALLLAVPEIRDCEVKPIAVRWVRVKDEERDDYLKQVTDVILSKFCLDDEGKVDLGKMKSVSNWRRKYMDEDYHFFDKVNVNNVYEALKTSHPEFFGWGIDKIHPGEIYYEGVYDGEEAKRNFRSNFAFMLSHMGLGKIVEKENRVSYELTPRDFQVWCLSNSVANFAKCVDSKGYNVPGFREIASRIYSKGFKILFDVNKNLGSVEKRVGEKLITKLFEENSGPLSIYCGLSSFVQEEIAEEEKSASTLEVKPVEIVRTPMPIVQVKIKPELGTRMLGYIRVFDTHQTNATVVIGLLKSAFVDLSLDPALLNNKKTVFGDEELKEKVRKYLVLSEKSFGLIVKFLGGCRMKNLDAIPVRTLSNTDAIEF